MSTIRYTHLRNTRPVLNYADHTFTLVPTTKGGVTVAWTYDDTNRRLTYNASICSMKDNFCRRIGRAIASGRLVSDRDTKVVPYKDISGEDRSPSYKEVNQYLASVVI